MANDFGRRQRRGFGSGHHETIGAFFFSVARKLNRAVSRTGAGGGDDRDPLARVFYQDVHKVIALGVGHLIELGPESGSADSGGASVDCEINLLAQGVVIDRLVLVEGCGHDRGYTVQGQHGLASLLWYVENRRSSISDICSYFNLYRNKFRNCLLGVARGTP